VFVRVWRYRVPSGQVEAFEAAYGSTGDWAQLFARGVGYLGTDLARDADDSAVWLTLDRWASRAAWEAFLNEHSDAYDALDERLADLSAEQSEIITGETDRPH
jgi:heme-degrading monooxygenase HmoA